MSAADRPAEVLDLRLVPAAVLSWLMVIVGLLAGWSVAFGLGGFALVAVALAGVRIARESASGASHASGVLAAVGCVAALASIVGVQTFQLERHPLRLAAQRGAVASLRVRAAGDPAPILAAGTAGYGGRPAAASQVMLPAELLTATIDGRRWTLSGRVLLLAPLNGWADVLPGVELTATGTLIAASQPDLTVAVLRVRGPPERPSVAPWWQRAAGALRAGLRQAASSVLSEDPAALLPGLAVGDTSTMSAPAREEFRTTGLTHLTAVSGANVAIVCASVFGLLGLLRAGPRIRVLGAALALVGFVVLARPSPSVLRAAVMGAVGLLAVVAGRRRSAVPALAAAVIGLLLVDPALGIDPGFTLSVLATGALVLLAPVWSTRLREMGVPAGPAEALAVPAAAHLITTPVIAGMSGQISLVAVVTNLLAAPAVAPATVLGVLAAVVSPISPAAAKLCAWLAGPSVRWLVGVAHWGAGIQTAAVSWPSGVAGGLLAALAVLTGLALARHRRVRALFAAVLLGFLLVFVPTRFVTPGWPPASWVVVACDVGQGDAIVLNTGEPGRAVLVDTGTETGAVDGCLSRLGVDALPLVVITHLHADHMGGLAQALSGRSVGAVAVGPAREPRWAFEGVRRAANDARVPVVELSGGQRLRWPGLELEVLASTTPSVPVDPDDGTAVNDGSLVIRARTPLGTVLLTGDIELLAQANLLASGADLRADVLKVPHHGSRATSLAFLAAVRPRLALVSVGADNRYGHPSAAVLDALQRAGALVRRTDQAGDLAVVAARDGLAAVARGSQGVRRRTTRFGPKRS
ncbi:MAG: DNA internalization-related competence protein ComEC/Rec2 [Pseudonocardia sp.]|nr:DNA internalization-related competence protein ComEC/Rec2 [Pseudonocardia sp.]